jgi:hypothetical protein
MSLAAIFEKARPVIDAALARAGFEKPFHELGEEHLPRADKLPAIVWVPVGGPIVPPRQAGAVGAVAAGAAVVLAANQNPRHLWTRDETIRLRISAGCEERPAWAPEEPFGGFRETEALLNAVVAVMKEHLTPWTFRPGSVAWTFSWPTKSEEPRHGFISGHSCTLDFQLSIPLTAEKQMTAQATSATITPEITT